MLKRINCLLLILLFVLISGCCVYQKNPLIMPVITPEIAEKVVFNQENKQLVDFIFYNGKGYLVLTKGELQRIDLDEQKSSGIFSFRSEIKQVYQNKGLLLLISSKKEAFTFDLESFNVISSTTFVLEKDQTLLTFNQRFWVFCRDDVLFVYDLKNSKIEKFKIDNNRYYKGYIYRDSIWVVSESGIIKYQKGFYFKKFISALQTFSFFEYPMIFLADKNLEFFLYNLETNKRKWTFRLDNELAQPPLIFEHGLILITKNNCVYFLNRQGTVQEFFLLKNYSLFGPLIIKDYVLIPLINGGVQVKKIGEKESFLVAEKRKVDKFFVWKDKLYLFEKQAKSSELVNIFPLKDFIVQFSTKNLYLPGKNFSFSIKSINLPNPRFVVILLSADKKIVSRFELSRYDKKDVSLVFDQPGNYQLQIEAFPERGGSVKKEFSVRIYSPLIFFYLFQIFLPGIF